MKAGTVRYVAIQRYFHSPFTTCTGERSTKAIMSFHVVSHQPKSYTVSRRPRHSRVLRMPVLS